MLERFADEPGVAVELARAALKSARTAAEAQADPGGSGAGSKTTADRQAGGEGAAAAEALVLELAGDERLLERVCEEAGLRRELLGLLWNHAVAALHGAQAFDSALAFFSAALPLLEDSRCGATQEPMVRDSQEEGPTPAACRRAQALCCLGARQFDRCAEGLSSVGSFRGSLAACASLCSLQMSNVPTGGSTGTA